jgi:hypothetical protein
MSSSLEPRHDAPRPTVLVTVAAPRAAEAAPALRGAAPAPAPDGDTPAAYADWRAEVLGLIGPDPDPRAAAPNGHGPTPASSVHPRRCQAASTTQTKGHLMNPDNPEGRTTAQLAHDEQADPLWMDRLVELQVLADNGDTAAAAAAASWIAEDGEARRVWEDVQRTCAQVRATRQGE